MTGESELATGSSSIRILPPRPRRRDWALAGLCAGLLLGLTEWALLWVGGVHLPQRVALPLFGGAALLVAVPATLMGVAISRARLPSSHSILVGALVGPLLLAPVFGGLGGALLDSFTSANGTGRSILLTILAALLALLGAGAAGVLGARTGARLEEGGLPVSGPLVFGCIGVLLAVGENVAAGALRPGMLLPVGLLLVGVTALVTLATTVAARRGAVPWPWGRTLAVLVVVAALAPVVPRALPWLLFQADEHPPADGPPSVLLVDLGSLDDEVQRGVGAPDAWIGPDVAVLAEEGVRYDDVRGLGAAGLAAALLSPPGEAPVMAAVAARGYATAAFVRDSERGAALNAPRLYENAGAGALLRAAAPRTAAGPLATALPRAALSRMGLLAEERTPAELTGDALDWLRWWRATRSVSPVFLAIDYGSRSAPVEPRALDPEVRRLLTGLEQLELTPRTVVVVGGSRATAADASGAHSHALVMRAPPVSTDARRDVVVDRVSDATTLAALLRELPERDAEHVSTDPTWAGVP